MTSSGWGEGGQVKNGQNQMKVDDYRQGGGGTWLTEMDVQSYN